MNPMRRRTWNSALVVAVLALMAVTSGTGDTARPHSGDVRHDDPADDGGPWLEAAPSGALRTVAPWGDDGAAGTDEAPWRTLQHALESLGPGDTLDVRGGTYVEDVVLTGSMTRPGTVGSPVRVRAHPGERPVLVGLLWLTNASHWHLDGIDVTWNDANTSDEHMVKFRGGTGWRLSNAELWGARSYAALLIGPDATSFRVDHNYVHDTVPANGLNQDHLVYVDNGPTGSGVIEHNVLARSPNGRGVKVGAGRSGGPGTRHIVIRHNTFVANTGPSNVHFSGSSSDNQVYRNVFDTAAPGGRSVTAYELIGTGNVVSENLWWRASAVADFDEDGLRDGGGNLSVDPVLADPAHGDYRPTNPLAAVYGASVEDPPGDDAVSRRWRDGRWVGG